MAEAVEIPEVSNGAMVFGDADEHLPSWRDLPDEFKHMRGPFCEAASQLFFKGGCLSDHRLKFKDGVDQERAYRMIRALLGSFASKHEHKIGGVGYLLSQWCDHAPT